MTFIKRNFDDCDERLYRAVFPNLFKKENGSLSSAAFKDSKGLSVHRGDKESTEKMVDFMLNDQKLQGAIVSVNVGNCYELETLPVHLPSRRSEKHSEIHRNKNQKLLSGGQAKKMARLAKIDKEP